MANRSIILFLCLIVSSLVYSQEYPGMAIGGAYNDNGYSICLTPENGYAIVGASRSTESGTNKYYFVKLDSLGNILYMKSYGSSNQDLLRKIIYYQNGFVMVGDGYNYWPWLYDSYFMKTDEYGNLLLSKYFNQHGWDNGFDILPTEDDNFIILGHSRVVNPKGDISLMKTDLQGNEMWKKFFYEDFNIYAFEIIKATDSQGYVMIGAKNGFFDVLHAEFQTHDADVLFIKVDSNGEELWRKTYGEEQHDFGFSLCQSSDGGYYLFGSSQSYGSGSFDMLLIKTDSEGEEQWHKSYGGTSFEYGKAIATTPEGNLYLLGSTKSYGMDGSVDVFVIKTDEYGEELWSQTIGGNKNDFGEGLVVTPDSGCAIVGSTESFGSGGKDFYFLKLKSNGDIEVLKGGNLMEYSNLLEVFPNPMTDYSTFLIHNTNVSLVEFNLYDESGKKVRSKKFTDNTFAVKREFLKRGIYFYKIVSQENPTIIFKGKLIVN